MSNAHLPLSFRRFPPDEDDLAIDSIAVDPRSSGHLHLPGSYSSDSPPPSYRWKVMANGDTGVDVQSVDTGTSDEYVVKIEVHNHRDSPSFVKLFWV